MTTFDFTVAEVQALRLAAAFAIREGIEADGLLPAATKLGLDLDALGDPAWPEVDRDVINGP